MIEVAPRSGIIMTYEEAILYCVFCDHNGYSDWRMPTFDEYFSEGLRNSRVGWYIDRTRDSKVLRKVCPVRYMSNDEYMIAIATISQRSMMPIGNNVQ